MDRRFVALAVLLLIFAAGCQNQDRGNKADPRTGTKGLVLEFVPGSPPDKIVGDELNVAVKLKNDGATGIENSKGFGGNIYISGFDSSIVKFRNANGMPYPIDGINLLAGRSMYDPIGETEIKEFPASVSLPAGIDTYKTTFMVTSCYSYETLAAPLICIDPDPFSIRAKQRACTSKDISLSGGQGAPIPVTKISLSPSSGKKLRLSIDIANSGGGTVYDIDSPNCDPYKSGLTSKEKDQVRVDEVSLAGANILSSCKPLVNGKIGLIGGKRTILCELDTAAFSNSPAFSTPITVRLRYGYSSFITKNVEILRAP